MSENSALPSRYTPWPKAEHDALCLIFQDLGFKAVSDPSEVDLEKLYKMYNAWAENHATGNKKTPAEIEQYIYKLFFPGVSWEAKEKNTYEKMQILLGLGNNVVHKKELLEMLKENRIERDGIFHGKVMGEGRGA